MSDKTVRPIYLPDFTNPPLNEVVLGVQFAQPKGYQQIYAGEIWKLFKEEFSQVQEQSPIPPSFETFGLPAASRGEFNYITGAIPNRFWFLRPNGDELIQFQSDRLIHNWKKVGDESNKYPRYEYIVKRFKSEFEQIQSYINTLSPQSLIINQCEVTYVNHIKAEQGEPLVASDWLRFLKFDTKEPDDFTLNFREIIADKDGKPYGRLICESSIAFKGTNQKIIQINLSVRGAPKESNIESALEFITKGRDLIVSRFADMTTESAHKIWERVK